MTPGVFKNRYMDKRKFFAKYKKEPFESFETLKETYEMKEVSNFNIKDAITKALLDLTPREEVVVRMTFGIGVDTTHTLSQIGSKYSVSPERTRQILAKALRKLKHPSRNKELKTYYEEAV